MAWNGSPNFHPNHASLVQIKKDMNLVSSLELIKYSHVGDSVDNKARSK